MRSTGFAVLCVAILGVLGWFALVRRHQTDAERRPGAVERGATRRADAPTSLLGRPRPEAVTEEAPRRMLPPPAAEPHPGAGSAVPLEVVYALEVKSANGEPVSQGRLVVRGPQGQDIPGQGPWDVPAGGRTRVTLRATTGSSVYFRYVGDDGRITAWSKELIYRADESGSEPPRPLHLRCLPAWSLPIEVLDEPGEATSGAVVYRPDNPCDGLKSDANGRCALLVAPEGNIELRARTADGRFGRCRIDLAGDPPRGPVRIVLDAWILDLSVRVVAGTRPEWKGRGVEVQFGSYDEVMTVGGEAGRFPVIAPCDLTFEVWAWDPVDLETPALLRRTYPIGADAREVVLELARIAQEVHLEFCDPDGDAVPGFRYHFTPVEGGARSADVARMDGTASQRNVPYGWYRLGPQDPIAGIDDMSVQVAEEGQHIRYRLPQATRFTGTYEGPFPVTVVVVVVVDGEPEQTYRRNVAPGGSFVLVSPYVGPTAAAEITVLHRVEQLAVLPPRTQSFAEPNVALRIDLSQFGSLIVESGPGGDPRTLEFKFSRDGKVMRLDGEGTRFEYFPVGEHEVYFRRAPDEMFRKLPEPLRVTRGENHLVLRTED